MKMTYEGLLNICGNPKIFDKITIFEGPDSSGKTTFVNKILDNHKNSHVKFIKVRCPDNRNGAHFRDLIMSDEIARNSTAQMFLFLADMLHAFDTIIKPHLEDESVKFIFDRFLSSTSVYQHTSLDYLNYIFAEGYPEFTEVFSKAHYIYLSPKDLDSHKERIFKKANEELNHFDPVSDEEIKENIEAYETICNAHKLYGLLGSKKVDVCIV